MSAGSRVHSSLSTAYTYAGNKVNTMIDHFMNIGWLIDFTGVNLKWNQIVIFMLGK